MPVCCNSVLGGAALAVQGHADVELPTGVCKAGIESICSSILETGGRKTSTDEHALAGVFRYDEAELRELYDEKLSAYQNRHDAWKAERDKITRDKKSDFVKKRQELDARGVSLSLRHSRCFAIPNL